MPIHPVRSQRIEGTYIESKIFNQYDLKIISVHPPEVINYSQKEQAAYQEPFRHHSQLEIWHN